MGGHATSPHPWLDAPLTPGWTPPQFTSQTLLDQSQASVYSGKCHIPPTLGHFEHIRVPYPKGLNG